MSYLLAYISSEISYRIRIQVIGRPWHEPNSFEAQVKTTTSREKASDLKRTGTHKIYVALEC